jgi:hypothetical protein
MGFADRILSGLKTVVLIDEGVTSLAATTKDFEVLAESKLADHDRRLTRRETIIEIARPTAQRCGLRPPNRTLRMAE